MARLAAAAALATLLVLPCLGCGVDDRPRISIEFGMYPEELTDAQVIVNGQLVGTLERIGQATRTSFPVEPGIHEVTIRHPRLRSVPRRVEAELPGQKVRLMADIRETWHDGRVRPLIVLDG